MTARLEAHTEPTFRISDLCAILETYLEPEQVREVYRAYLFGAEAHDGQLRLSGEPYITHPLAVARILAEMRMDYQGIIAAILHDVIEDTPTAKEQLVEQFGEEVAELVDGVSKIAQIDTHSKAEAQAESFRKMILAMVQDIRVILIKLADRLHNMRTLGVMRPEKRRRIARETLEIYAPLANRLGMNRIRHELEDLGFEAMYPMRYRVLREAARRLRGNRKEVLQKIEAAIKRRLRQEDLPGKVISREKHLYSIFRKMRNKRLRFRDVYDMYAFRIIVDKVDTCYRVLGAVHNLYKPVPGNFKDYIAIPKANGYQSLHTVLFGPYGEPIEVQIRTEDMDSVAEAGVAAHWSYKLGETVANTRATRWMRDVLEMQKHAGNSMEFIENLKIDLFPDEVYVFTPRGDILELPRGATAVDFAYAVHSDIGNTCVAVRIDRQLAPLRSVLYNGQTVEVITAPGAHPNPSWLNFVTTAKARSNIRAYLKNLRQHDAIELGRRLLDTALAQYGYKLADFRIAHIRALVRDYKYESPEAMLADIGLGNRMPQLVARQLVPEDEGSDVVKKRRRKSAAEKAGRRLAIRGTEGMLVTYAKCCKPIPGDPIIGHVSAGRGIVIHTETCKNVGDYRKSPEKWIDVEWERDIDSEFLAEIRVDVANQRGVLATVAAEISNMESNIENIHIEERDGLTTSMIFNITVRDRKHLANIMRRIRSLKMVIRIHRRKG